MRQLALRAAPLFVLLLGGCAAIPAAQTATTTDTAKMAAMDRAALRNGVRILWINPPQRRGAAPGS